MTENPIHALVGKIDDIKEKISDGDYMKIMELLKNANDEKKVDNKKYVIRYRKHYKMDCKDFREEYGSWRSASFNSVMNQNYFKITKDGYSFLDSINESHRYLNRGIVNEAMLYVRQKFNSGELDPVKEGIKTEEQRWNEEGVMVKLCKYIQDNYTFLVFGLDTRNSQYNIFKDGKVAEDCGRIMLCEFEEAFEERVPTFHQTTYATMIKDDDVLELLKGDYTVGTATDIRNANQERRFKFLHYEKSEESDGSVEYNKFIRDFNERTEEEEYRFYGDNERMKFFLEFNRIYENDEEEIRDFEDE